MSSFSQDVELARLAAIVASTSDAIVSKDLDGIVNSWNAAAERIFGYSAAEMIGAPITTIIPPDLQHEENVIIGRIRDGERLDHFDTVRLTKDGRLIDVSITVSPLRNRHGEIVGASKIARDITERKRSEELQALLVNELNHRTKNLLATVHAIAAQTFAPLPGSAEPLRLFSNRVRALTVSQDLLTRNGWNGSSVEAMLPAVLSPFGLDKRRIKIARGPDLQLNLRQTNALAMAVHELATNATKYGALSTDTGCVRLSWRQQDGEAVLDWQEEGGPPVSPPKRTGFGTEMIQNALKHELNAQVDVLYTADGVRCTIAFPS